MLTASDQIDIVYVKEVRSGLKKCLIRPVAFLFFAKISFSSLGSKGSQSLLQFKHGVVELEEYFLWGSLFIFMIDNFLQFEAMIEQLLHEANEHIVRIDTGEIVNNREERNYVAWRLNRISHYQGHPFFEKIKSTYNSLWSHLYRLEHTAGFVHPLVKKFLKEHQAG